MRHNVTSLIYIYLYFFIYIKNIYYYTLLKYILCIYFNNVIIYIFIKIIQYYVCYRVTPNGRVYAQLSDSTIT